MAIIGDRVVAIRSANNGVVKYFGIGYYVGDFPIYPSVAGDGWASCILNQRDIPCVALEDGNIIWGCECWWGCEKEAKKRFGKDWKWEKVEVFREGDSE
jgi:hypothetical protein